ncbi:MAG: hypothetical protein S4CHLAM123_04600 [Chlamydiales bacterium]|nr:hypothetical protein [Chlamydiales bacterium]
MTQQTRSLISFATYLINTKQELHYVLDAVTKKIDWAPFEKMLSMDKSLNCSIYFFKSNL